MCGPDPVVLMLCLELLFPVAAAKGQHASASSSDRQCHDPDRKHPLTGQSILPSMDLMAMREQRPMPQMTRQGHTSYLELGTCPDMVLEHTILATVLDMYLVRLDHLGDEVGDGGDALAAEHGHGLLLLGAAGCGLYLQQLVSGGQEAGGSSHEQQVGPPGAASRQHRLACIVARGMLGAVHHLIGVEQPWISSGLPAHPLCCWQIMWIVGWSDCIEQSSTIGRGLALYPESSTKSSKGQLAFMGHYLLLQ